MTNSSCAAIDEHMFSTLYLYAGCAANQWNVDVSELRETVGFCRYVLHIQRLFDGLTIHRFLGFISC